MKTKLKKTTRVLLPILLAIFSLSAFSQNTQEVNVKEVEGSMEIKIINKNNGTITIIDTIVQDIENFDMESFEKAYNINLGISGNDVLTITGDDVMEGKSVKQMQYKIITTDNTEKGKGKTIVSFMTEGDEDIKINKQEEMVWIQSDQVSDSTIVKTIRLKKSNGEDIDESVFIIGSENKGGETLNSIEISKTDGEIFITSNIIIVDIATDHKNIPDAVLKDLNKAEANSLELKDLEFYPNPAEEFLNITFSAKDNEPVMIELFDLNGKKVLSEQQTAPNGKFEHKINISNLDPGLYFLNIIQGNCYTCKKIILK